MNRKVVACLARQAAGRSKEETMQHRLGNRRWVFVLAVAAAVATVVAPATASVRSNAASVPANLCTLKVAAQLKAIGVGTNCKQAKTATVGPLTIAGANWGKTDDSVGVQVYKGVDESRFKLQFGKTGLPVSLGSFAREASGASGVSLSAWINGVGLVVNFNHPGAPSKNKAYRAPVLALAKAIAKQI